MARFHGNGPSILQRNQWRFNLMRILFLADNFPPERNAQAARVFERACYWVKWGHAVTVITSAPNFPDGALFPGYKNRWWQVEEIDGIRVVRVKTLITSNKGTILRVLDFLSYMLMAYLAGLGERRPDLIATSSPQFFAAVAAWALSATRRLPFVLELSDLWPESIMAVGAMKRSVAMRWLEKLELFLYRKADRIVTLTVAFKQNLMQRGVPGSKIDVVINGVDLPRYAPRARDAALANTWGLAEGDFVVGYIGTHGMAHGLGNVLAAAALIGSCGVRFLFVGAGSERDMLMAEASRLGLGNVVFVPAQPKEMMPAFWSLCDVALIHLKNAPTFATVIPSKIFEAMGMGLPILLASPKGEASDIIESESVGLWTLSNDPKALADAVILLRNDSSQLSKLAAQSLAMASQHSRERQASEMLLVLKKGANLLELETPPPAHA
jgi:glycosyltransferase involved in cell wall biosynthesis